MELIMKKRLICCDLDGTLSQHRTPIEDGNAEVLKALDGKYKLLMVGAGSAERIYRQLNCYPIDILGNYGMQESRIVNGAFTVIRSDASAPDREYFIKTADYLRVKYGYTDYKGASVEFHGTGMVTVPLLGSEADIADKLVFDPDRAKRRRMYGEVLELFPDYSVYIGGTSSFDFTEKRYNKYDAIMRYARENGYEKNEILFVGDDFGDGGGDSHVRINGMDYVEITDYRALRESLSFLM